MPRICFKAIFAIALSTLVSACYTPSEERLNTCLDARHIATAHLFGSDLALQAKPGSTWQDLVPSHIPPMASAMTIKGLREQRGVPDRSWQVDDRPFVLYKIPQQGTLQLGVEASRSGSDEHRAWRLWWSGPPVALSESISEETFECIGDLARANQEVVILRSDGYPAARFLVEEGLVVAWYWSRRYEWDHN